MTIELPHMPDYYGNEGKANQVLCIDGSGKRRWTDFPTAAFELPPLPFVPSRWSDVVGGYVVVETDHIDYCTVAEARERILLARIAELEGYVEGYQGIVGRMEADAARYRWLLDELRDDCKYAFGVHREGDSWSTWALHCASRRLQIEAAMKEAKP